MHMEMKKYIDPEMEVTMFAEEDVITTSGFVKVDGDNNVILPDDDLLP